MWMSKAQREAETCPKSHRPSGGTWPDFQPFRERVSSSATSLPHPARDPVQVIQDRLYAVQPVLHYLARGPVPCSLGVRRLLPGLCTFG